MFIDFNQIARIAKFVALLAFFLPWVTVSCSNTEILHATGWQLMTGHPQPAGPLENMNREQIDDIKPAIAVIAAFGLILIGLGAGILNRAQSAAISMLVSAVLAIGVTYFGMAQLQTQLREQISGAQAHQQVDENSFISAEQQRQLSQSVAENITVRKEDGYWLTLGALGLAALFSLLTLMRRPSAQPQAPPS